MMNKHIRKLYSKIAVPVTKRYLKKTRHIQWHGLQLEIPPGVFHPGLFYSTHTMYDFIRNKPLQQKNVLEMGCGSGALSITMARQQAKVTAADIHVDAVRTTLLNALQNDVGLHVVISDLFNAIPHQLFDYIVVNPPFYAHTPHDGASHAWYAGEKLEYFDRFFSQAKAYLAPGGKLWMVYSTDCDIQSIHQKATYYQWNFTEVFRKRHLTEENFVVEYHGVLDN